MPESKKLSELIEELCNYNYFLDKSERNGDYKNHYNAKFAIKKIKTQIDQKFEELRCECRSGEVKEELKIQEKMQNRFREGFNLGIKRGKDLCDAMINILNKPIDMTMLLRQIDKLVSEEKKNLKNITLPIITLYEDDSEKD